MNRVMNYILTITGFILGVSFALPAEEQKPLPESPITFTTNDGATYKDVTVSGVDATSIHVVTSTGITKIKFGNLPVEVQKSFGLAPSEVLEKPQDQSGEQEASKVYPALNRFKEGELWGYLDGSKAVVMPPQFTYAGEYSKGVAKVWTNRGYGYVDSNGAVVSYKKSENEVRPEDGDAEMEAQMTAARDCTATSNESVEDSLKRFMSMNLGAFGRSGHMGRAEALRMVLSGMEGMSNSIAQSAIIQKNHVSSIQSERNPAKLLTDTLGMKFVLVPGTKVMFCTTKVTVDQWKTYGHGYENPDFPQEGDHPAINISWNDATAFCRWLSAQDGRTYRLPTDHEWSCAVGIGDKDDAAAPDSKSKRIENVYPWGVQWPPPSGIANYRGEESLTASALTELKMAHQDTYSSGSIAGFQDGYVFTAPVNSFKPNALGIYGLGGNAWEWCDDKYNPSGSWRVTRGGGWGSCDRESLLSSFRGCGDQESRNPATGFRIVMEVAP